jgi:hemerythrin superfamily protein
MNDRIRELIKQATTIEVLSGRGFDETQYTERFDQEKFAQFIVQECLMKAIGAKIRGESIDTLIQNIKEDFGVEE